MNHKSENPDFQVIKIEAQNNDENQQQVQKFFPYQNYENQSADKCIICG